MKSSLQTSSRGFDLAGMRFGRLLVVSLENGLTAQRGRRWLCQCECGKAKVIAARNLRSGATQSCGCLGHERRIEGIRRTKTTHGETAGHNSRTYRIWANMVTRCTNPNFDAYPHYGGRGITVCERWRTFSNFLADMGRVPGQMSIDRIDVDGNYEPANCRWATQQEQCNNRRNNRVVEWQGKQQTVAQLARLTGVKAPLLYGRLALGWPVERAVSEPPRLVRA